MNILKHSNLAVLLNRQNSVTVYPCGHAATLTRSELNRSCHASACSFLCPFPHSTDHNCTQNHTQSAVSAGLILVLSHQYMKSKARHQPVGSRQSKQSGPTQKYIASQGFASVAWTILESHSSLVAASLPGGPVLTASG